MADLGPDVDAVYDALIRAEFLKLVEDPRLGGRFSDEDRQYFRQLAATAPLELLGHNLYDLPEGPWEPT